MKRLLILAAALALSACGKPDPNVMVLSYASPYIANHPFSRADIVWMKWIEEKTEGRIKIHPHWGGHLLSSNENMLEIRHGVADIGMVTPMYARSAHIQRIQPSFYSGVTDIGQQIAVYRCLADEFPVMNGELNGLRVIAVQGGNFPGILTRNKPIRSLADLQGLRLRAQADTADVLRSFGVDVVNMSMAEVYPAMAKGVIDGVVAPADALRSMHLADVGKYYSTIKIPRGAYPGRALSMQVWNRLSDADKAIFIESEKVWEDAMVASIDKGLIDGFAYAREAGLNIIPMPAAEQARFDGLYRENAFRIAKHLEPFGVDGPAMAKRAEELIRNGVPAGCGAPK
ncbi:TRAP transporter substrate-binding protein DctP [Sphingomonas sp. AOB5]|uniref:TRAP transporter substrate-binding protein DctP n=1 Tax=Sphingomonas sp. AOB5 TaxID=3034017 RepID=UPI0023F7FF78|nr:TRAP transporter substrate-binding protein DctP [Sphingomonas sp. AOB5]MDF7776354.1 TRAP transporter substrate-binding protein DctP [Sphingomonas sp. AOB5]